MRALRAVFFFFFGLLLGGSAVTAFAAQIEGPARYGPSVNFNYPDGLEVRRRSGPIYDWPDAPNGWGNMRDVNKMSIGGRDVNIEGIRKFQPINLARSAVTMAKLLGPISIGLTVLDLLWDEGQGWLYDPPPTETTDQPRDYQDGAYWLAGWPGSWSTPRAACLAMRPNQPTTGVYWWDSSSQFSCQRESGYSPLNWGRGPRMTCPEGSTDLGDGNCRVAGEDPEPRPATDAEIEDAIYVDLVARGMGSDLARRLIEAGYTLAPDGHEAVGPSSIPGDTITSTTSGPAGTTTTTISTTNNLTYNTDNTTNTTTVTVTQTTNTTTTAPDGTTTTSVATKAPAPGETAPEEEPKAFCDLFPDASACQKLDIPEGQPVEPEEVNVTFAPSGGFGSEGGSCPSPYSFSVQGRAFSIDYQPFCNFFVAVRPVVIAMAFITAMLIALGGYKRD